MLKKSYGTFEVCSSGIDVLNLSLSLLGIYGWPEFEFVIVGDLWVATVLEFYIRVSWLIVAVQVLGYLLDSLVLNMSWHLFDMDRSSNHSLSIA